MFHYKQRYEDLLHVINGYAWQDMPGEAQIVNCVQLCFILLKEIENDAWVAALLPNQRVAFNKTIYAGIVEEIELLLLLYHALQFHPSEGEDAKIFWRNERRRLDRFADQESDFFRYYKIERTDEDERYYGRLEVPYLPSPSVKTGPVLLGRARALQRYIKFVNRQLKRCRLH